MHVHIRLFGGFPELWSDLQRYRALKLTGSRDSHECVGARKRSDLLLGYMEDHTKLSKDISKSTPFTEKKYMLLF